MQNFENLTEKQVESREIFDGYIMHVFKDTVELPNGKLAPREYMRHVGAVCVVPLLDDGSVLLERQFRYPVGKVLMEIPASSTARTKIPEKQPRASFWRRPARSQKS